MLPDEIQVYVGQTHTFPDGKSITIKEIKRRDEFQYWVTYVTNTGPGLPRKQIMLWEEFLSYYKHLFKA